MKKVISILCLGTVLTCASCESWLDVRPKSEIKWDVMFETEQGFRDALLGCYVKLSEKSLYGAEMTCCFLDVLAQQYYAKNTNSYREAFSYSYTGGGVTGITDAIWEKMYNVLANVNALIEAAETQGDVLSPTSRALLKAEGYALRSYIYLDLVRLFTWGNLAERPDRDEKLVGLAIPYAKVYDKYIIPQETLENVLNYIHEDLDLAISLFLDYSPDSKKGSRPEDYTEFSKEDIFYTADLTKYRMNLKAAMATRMRLNMWEGNYDEAYEDALTLKDSYSPVWMAEGDLTNSDVTRVDLTFSKEMFFGLEAHERFEQVIERNFKRKSNNMNDNSQFMSLPEERAFKIYEREEGLANADWRYVYWWVEKTETNYRFNKFWEEENMKNANNIPLIRTPEIYYSEAECLLRKGGEANKVKAIEALNEVRNHRGLSQYSLPTTLTRDRVYEELEKEWRKEFVGDGQMFFYYKRTGNKAIPYATVTCDDNIYVLPLPQQEVDFGGCEDLIERK